MKVLSTRAFREYFKSSIALTQEQNKNPHFAGSSRKLANGEVELGFFTMYHGPKGGNMSNLLKTILDMARDSQALYEFMQNAVDAKSTEFILFHHFAARANQDYLIVYNNGEPFDLKGVVSILDIGASTKFKDEEMIGQFGVGFKLAHRLVGEDAALTELLDENKGPILFSWRDGELAQLANHAEPIEPIVPKLSGGLEDARCNNKEPWLFKILYTNFPCLCGEQIIDAKNRDTTEAFTAAELTVLREAAGLCIQQSVGVPTSGTLLLVPLHPSKKGEVASHANADGLPITADILSHRKGHAPLKQIVLNGQALAAANVSIEPFRYQLHELLDGINNEEDRKLLSGLKKIELDFCYENPLSGRDSFSGRPQFYLFFPMTEERHGFRFALQSNAFSFTTERTALHHNSPINRFLFHLFTNSLDAKLKSYAEEEREEFLAIFASLALSMPGAGGDWKANRAWLQQDFWEPLMRMTAQHIPVRSGENWAVKSSFKKCVVKRSALPLEKWMSRNSIEWFYWDATEQPLLCELASQKFKLDCITIADVLEDESAIPLINKWLEQNAENAKQLLRECAVAVRNDTTQKRFWDHLKELKLWRFDGMSLSATELKESAGTSLLMKFSAVRPIAAYLQRAGIALSEISLSDFEEFFEGFESTIRGRLSGELPYLRNYELLNGILSRFFARPKLFNAVEKKEIFSQLFDAIKRGTSVAGDRPKMIKPLALFSNRAKQVKPLHALIGTEKVPELLQGWRIQQEEHEGLSLEEFLANRPEEIYTQVIVPFWKDITAQQCTPQQREDLFNYVKQAYQQGLPTLNAADIFFSEDGNVAKKRFYHDALAKVPDEEYHKLNTAMQKAGLGILPQRTLLTFYATHPFRLSNDEIIIGAESGIQLTMPEASSLLQFALRTAPDFMERNIVASCGNETITMRRRSAGQEMGYSMDETVQAYIARHHSALIMLPDALPDEIRKKVLHDTSLYQWLIAHVPEAEESKAALACLLLQAKDDEKSSFLITHGCIALNALPDEHSTDYCFLRLCFSIADEGKRKNTLDHIVALTMGDKRVLLRDVQNRGSDTVQIAGSQHTFSVAKLLPAASNFLNQQLTEAAAAWAHLGMAGNSFIEASLGIRNQREASQVFEALVHHLQNGTLENGEQLAFVLQLAAHQKVTELSHVFIKTAAGISILADGTFYFCTADNTAMLPDAALLSTAYNTAIPLFTEWQNNQLQLAGVTLCKSPSIDDAGRLRLPGVNEVPKEQQPAFLAGLLQLWKDAGTPEKIVLPQGLSNWQALIGYDAAEWVLEPEFALEEEQVCYTSLQLPDDKEGTKFLEALGAHGVDSPVVQLRKFLARKGGARQQLQQPVLVRRTLHFLAQNKIAVENHDLVNLYEKTLHPEKEVLPPLPVCSKVSEQLIVTAFLDGAMWVGIEIIERLQQKSGFTISRLANAANAPIVVLFPCLSPLAQRIKNELKQLEIKWEQTDWGRLKSESKEWENPAYAEWKVGKGVQIFLYPHAIPMSDLVYGNSISEYSKGDIAYNSTWRIFYLNSKISEAELLTELIQGHPNEADWESLEASVQKDALRVQRLLARARINPQLNQTLERMLKEIEQTELREEKFRHVTDLQQRYTIQWFLNLLDLVAAQEKKTGVSDIRFSVCRPTGVRYEYELSETESNIPLNIEELSPIKTYIEYRGEGEDTNTETVELFASYRYRKLKVQIPKDIPPHIDTDRIVSVRLSFDRTVDLIGHLRQGYKRLLSQTDNNAALNLKETLSRNIRFLFGPPGTGKTTTLAKRIIAQMNAGPKTQIIVLTPTNKAANVLVRRIIKESGGAAPSWLVRTGNCNDSEIIPLLRNGADLVVNAQSHLVVITTIHRFPYQKAATRLGDTADTLLCDCYWSQVYFDEASMIPLAYITHAIYARQQVRPDTQFLIAGDPLQIPPVFDLVGGEPDELEELQEANIYSMIGLRSFVDERQREIPVYGDCIDNLKQQFRSVPAIGKLFSCFQYDDGIETMRGKPGFGTAESRPLPYFFAKELGFKPITVIRYKVQSGETIYRPRKLNGKSPFQLYAAMLVSELLRRFRMELETDQEAFPWTAGVLAPYRAQADLMGNMIDAHPEPSSKLKVDIDTVHGFQGDENQIVFAMLNPTSTEVWRSKFLKKEYILNVAISRAEDYLVLLVPEDISGLPLLANLLGIIQALPNEQWCELQASDVEHKLMKQRRFFEEHSFTTAHQSVNVYGQPKMPYLIRLSEGAVDVHWNEGRNA